MYSTITPNTIRMIPPTRMLVAIIDVQPIAISALVNLPMISITIAMKPISAIIPPNSTAALSGFIENVVSPLTHSERSFFSVYPEFPAALAFWIRSTLPIL